MAKLPETEMIIMTQDEIKKAKREQAEREYHDRLKGIDAEVEAKYAEYKVKLEIIEAAQKRVNSAFEHQKNELAGEYGLLDGGGVAVPVLNDPANNP